MGFLGPARSQQAERATEATTPALSAMVFLAALCFLLGILPTYVLCGIDRVAKPLTGSGTVEMLVPPFFAGSPGH